MTSISSTTSPEWNIRSSLTRRSPSRIQGFSLIELMIAIVLGLLVLAGLINLFVANNKAFQIQSGNNYLQENLRIATDRIGWSLRMADFWGGNQAKNIGGSGTSDGKTCNLAWATAVTSSSPGGGAVYGYDGASAFGTSPLVLDTTTCIGDPANYVPGSDVLVLRYAYPQTLSPGPSANPAVASTSTPAESSTITSNPKQTFLLATSDGSAQLFLGSAHPSSNGSTFPRYAYPYQVDMYYLRPCSVFAAGATVCTPAADGGSPLPTLMRAHLQSDGTFVSDPVVDGIEQLQFEYGVATDPTNVVPNYMTATDVTTNNDWPYVVSVRASMVAVSPTRDVTVPHAGPFTLGQLSTACTYTINNQAAPTIGSTCGGFKTPYGDNPWQFVRVSQQFVGQVRNRVRGQM